MIINKFEMCLKYCVQDTINPGQRLGNEVGTE